jgi:hypothetical protein
MSHTATGEWKSFEIRMRRRRAERLVLRADVATEAGCLDDARALLDEAKTLWLSAPGIGAVEERIRSAERAQDEDFLPVAESYGAGRTYAVELLAAAATLMLLTAAAAFAVTRYHAPLPAREVSTLVELVAPVAPVPIEPIAGNAVDTNVARKSDEGRPEGLRYDSRPERLASDVTSRIEPLSPVARSTIDLPLRPAPALRSDLQSARSPASVPDVPSGPPPAVESSAAAPPVVFASAPAASAPAEIASIEPSQDALVRGTLDRYAEAYSRLDADAAQRVWPDVNVAALTRAFDGLESQRVSLGDCQIQVDGTVAHARCAGTATWTPKVGGGGERADARSWTFDLEKAGARWQIVSARVQNR